MFPKPYMGEGTSGHIKDMPQAWIGVMGLLCNICAGGRDVV